MTFEDPKRFWTCSLMPFEVVKQREDEAPVLALIIRHGCKLNNFFRGSKAGTISFYGFMADSSFLPDLMHETASRASE